MKLSYRAAVAVGLAATFALAFSVPAEGVAASTWRLVLARHYGAATNFSSYGPGFALTKTDAWAFGGSDLSGGTSPTGVPVAVHWNGRAWRASALPAGVTGNIEAASADSARDIWAVTYLGGSILHWNGTRWSVSKHVTLGGQFTGVTAISRTDVWVFGAGGFLGGNGTWHFNGRTWTQFPSAAGIVAADALSASDMWAVGSVAVAEDSIWHYNGTTWRHVTATALKGLSFGALLAVSATSIWASPILSSLGAKGFLLHFNGRRWVRVSPPWAIAPSPVASDGHGGLWMYAPAFGSTGFWLVHRSATGRWSRAKIILATGGAGFPRPIPGTGSWWTFGAKGGATSSNAAIWIS